MFLIECSSTLQLSQLELYSKFSRIIFPKAINSISEIDDATIKATSVSTECWMYALDDSLSAMIKKLDLGLAKVIISIQSSIDEVSEWIQFIPKDRLIVSIDRLDSVLIQSIQPFVSGILLDLPNASIDQLLELVPLPSTPGFFICNCVQDLNDIAQLDKKGIDVILNSNQLVMDMQTESGQVHVGDLIVSLLKTDRPDGLFSTIVTNEHGTALGLCYSSKESICESIKTGEGVYFSRNRGFWHKGKTSGATQKLKSMTMDCDRDTLQFTVQQSGPGFCHLNTPTCFGSLTGVQKLMNTLQDRMKTAPEGSYTRRLFKDPKLLRMKIMEEAEELCDANSPQDIAWEAADLIYFALARCVSAGVSLVDIEEKLNEKSKKVSKRPGDAKRKWESAINQKDSIAPAAEFHDNTDTPASCLRICMVKYSQNELSDDQLKGLLQRPILDTKDIMDRVKPIMNQVKEKGDEALLELTVKFDHVQLSQTVMKAPFDPSLMTMDPTVKKAIDTAYENILKFHEAQLSNETLEIETMPGVVCSRLVRPIEKVGLYIPGGSAVLPSTALMLGIPAKVAGCKEIVIATPPRKDGSIVPEVLYVAQKVGASCVLLAGGAQAVAAMAYGTESVTKVDKICGPGNQYVTAAKMIAQADSSSMIAIDMPAGPSELLVIADSTCIPKYVASDLLSQAEHGPDSQVVLVAVNMPQDLLNEIEDEVDKQGSALPRSDIVKVSIPKSFILNVPTLEDALDFSNQYAPEHLILHLDDADECLDYIQNAGSVFVGHWSPESCGDYASGTNHTLPTYGYARMYSGVNTHTFLKHITSQKLTKEGLDLLGDTVMTLAQVEELEAHRNAVAIRLKDIRTK